MGLVALALLGLGAMALLVLLRTARPLWSLLGAVLMLGAVGYALQGSPTLPASPAAPVSVDEPEDSAMLALRDDMLGRYTLDAAYLTAADAMIRTGDERAAVRVLLGGIRKIPRSLALWTALGNAFALHDRQVSPPALFAFQQAMRLAPKHPAPPFFLGLAHIRSQDYAAARPLWARAAALSPEGASYRRQITIRLALLDQFLAQQGPPAR
jgi:cytochrome c-type biogenesis protein CcmH/NrfG